MKTNGPDGNLPSNQGQRNARGEITTVLDLCAGVNVFKPIRFTIDCPEAATAVADREYAQAILRPLVQNAAKHLPPTHGEELGEHHCKVNAGDKY